VSDIDTAEVDSLKALDPKRPIREATNAPQHDRRKKKDRQCAGLSEIRSGVLIRRLFITIGAPARSCLFRDKAARQSG
jgi:hypothetical protein